MPSHNREPTSLIIGAGAPRAGPGWRVASPCAETVARACEAAEAHLGQKVTEAVIWRKMD